MTIAQTGNRIVDAQARRGAAEAKREAGRAKAAAKKSGKSGSKGGKFKGAGRAGRAAARRGAKGISAKRLKRQNSGKKTAEYGLKDGAELIESNCGFDIPTIGEGLAPKMRPEIENQIERLTFSTPATSGKATKEQWRERVEYIRKELGIDDSFSFCASRHTDQDHDHIHLDFNRVSDTGKLWKDGQIGLRLAILEQKIERKFDLKLTRREDFVTHGNMNKKTFEMAVRDGKEPAFLFVQKAIFEAKQNKPDVLTFVSRLADQGIACRPNLKQGELNGFSYSKDGQSFTGKQVGANWAAVIKEVTYVTTEHHAALASLKQQLDAGATRPTQQVGPAPAAPAPTPSSEPRAERADRKSEVAPVRTRSVERLTELHIVGDVRVSRHQSIRKSLASYTAMAKLQSAGEHAKKLAAAAEKLASALTPDRSDVEVARVFLKATGGTAEARELMKSHLEISPEERTELLTPYLERMKTEAEYMRRMDEADRFAPSPEHNDGNGNTFTM